MTDIQTLVTENLDVWTSAVQSKSGVGRGNGKKLNLYGIKKLRELILELAVRGKLVPQNPNDEPASVLLEKIAAEKELLIKEKKIKKPKTLPEIGADDKPFELPKGWEFTRYIEAYDVRDGTHDSPKPQQSGFPLVTSKNLSSGKLDLKNVKYISEGDYLKIKERSKVDFGDILFAMIGSIGNPVVVDVDVEFSIKNVALFKYYNTSHSVPEYLKISLEIAAIAMREQSSGGVQPFVSLGKLRSFIMGIPPLTEQHRIVAKVNELMALCDQLEQQTEDSITAHKTLVENLLVTLTNSRNAEELTQNWNRISDHFETLFTTEESIDQLKQTILQLAVMGKLVPQDPNDKPASVLLEKIAIEKAQLIKEKKIKKQKELPPIGEDEKPFDLPMGWEWCYLNDIFGLVTDGDHQPPPKANAGIPFLVIGNLNTGKVLLENCRFVPNKYYELLDWGRKPSVNDLLYTVTGSYGIPIRVNVSDKFCVQRHVAILKTVTSTPCDYLAFLLKSKYAFQYATKIATGIAQKTVPLTGLRKMPVAVPPDTERYKIVAKVNKLMVICDQLKARIADNQKAQFQLADVITEQAVA